MTLNKSLPYPELSIALGQIVRQCSNLEGIISIFIGNLIGTDHEVGHIVTAGLSFNSLSSLLNALFRYRVSDPKAIKELERLLKRVENIQKRRNELIHATWGVDDKTDMFMRLKSSKHSKGFRKDREMVSLNTLETVIEQANEVGSDLISFLIHHVGPYPTRQIRRKKSSTKISRLHQ